jgi:hypothetical protein
VVVDVSLSDGEMQRIDEGARRTPSPAERVNDQVNDHDHVNGPMESRRTGSDGS